MAIADLLSAKEAATVLEVQVRQVHRLVESGQLAEAHKIAGVRGARLFLRSDVEALAEARRAKAAS